MNGFNQSSTNTGDSLEIIAFRMHDQEFCVHTTPIREIRGWGPATPIPHAPANVIWVHIDWDALEPSLVPAAYAIKDGLLPYISFGRF